MPTVELDIRQLADEGGTAPIAPITVTDAVLDENGDTLTDTLSEINSGLSKIDLASLNNIRFAANSTNDNATIRWYMNSTDYYMVSFTPTQIRYSKVISGTTTLLWAITAS